MRELAVVSGPLCGVGLFVTLAGGRLPRGRPRASPRALALRWTSLAAAAGLEEVLWRGLVLGGLAVAIGVPVALAVSSGGFALWHHAVLGRRAAVHVLTGLAFGADFLLGGLVAAILAHAVYNVLVDWAVQVCRAAR